MRTMRDSAAQAEARSTEVPQVARTNSDLMDSYIHNRQTVQNLGSIAEENEVERRESTFSRGSRRSAAEAVGSDDDEGVDAGLVVVVARGCQNVTSGETEGLPGKHTVQFV